VLLAYLLKQLNARACQQLKLVCLTLAVVTRVRNIYLGGLIELNRFVENLSSGMGSGWICGRPRIGIVVDCMRQTRVNYHYGVRQVKRDEDIVRDRLANALIDDPNRNFWAEVKKMRGKKACTSKTVDDCTDATPIAQLFALKYHTLYSNVSFDAAEMHNLLTELDTKVNADGGLSRLDHLILTGDILAAIGRLHLHKTDGG
jgi:hypothetical protein